MEEPPSNRIKARSDLEEPPSRPRILEDYTRFELGDLGFVDFNHTQAYVHCKKRKDPLLVGLPIQETSWHCDHALQVYEKGMLCCPVGTDEDSAHRCNCFYESIKKYQEHQSAQKNS